MTENKAIYTVVDVNYEHALDDLMHEIREMLMKKHADYGAGNLLKHGQVGIIVRLDDKMARLSNFFENKQEFKVELETVEDTYKDVIGYALQAILMLRGEIK